MHIQLACVSVFFQNNATVVGRKVFDYVTWAGLTINSELSQTSVNIIQYKSEITASTLLVIKCEAGRKQRVIISGWLKFDRL